MFSWQCVHGNLAGWWYPHSLLPSCRLWDERAGLSLQGLQAVFCKEPLQGQQFQCRGFPHLFLQGSTLQDAAAPGQSHTSKPRCSRRQDWPQVLRCCRIRGWNVFLQHRRLLQKKKNQKTTLSSFSQEIKKSSNACSLWFTCWNAFVNSQEEGIRSQDQGLLNGKKNCTQGKWKGETLPLLYPSCRCSICPVKL